MKKLGINLIKHIQDEHDENYKMMIKEMKENIKTWKEEKHANGSKDSI